jgi:hypothetical protein
MSSRPTRQAKQIALDNIKKQIAQEDQYDEYGYLILPPLPAVATQAELEMLRRLATPEPAVISNKINLREVKDAFANSTYFPKILALIPNEFRNDLVEGDARIGECIYALTDILYDYSHFPGQTIDPITTSISSVKDFAIAYNFYRHYYEEALNYIYDLIEEFEKGQEYDSEEDDGFMEKHYPATSRSYADKPDPELIKALMGAAYTPEAFAKIMKNN